MPPKARTASAWRLDEASARNAFGEAEFVVMLQSISTLVFGRMTTPESSSMSPSAKAQYLPFSTTLAVASAVIAGGSFMNTDAKVICAGAVIRTVTANGSSWWPGGEAMAWMLALEATTP